MKDGKKAGGPVTLDVARQLLCDAAGPVGISECLLDDCSGRVLAEDLTARMSQPPFRRSAMDGYALRSADTAGAGRETPVMLQVTGRVFAGDTPLPAGSVRPGTAVRIMTGAPVPDDADCVIAQEDTDEGEERVRVFESCAAGQCVCPVGEDFAEGDILCEKGTFIDAYLLSCACAAGVTSLPVRDRIRAGLILTGNELCRPGVPLPPGKIYNSSEVFLKARLRQLGCVIEESIFADDDQAKIVDAIRSLAGRCDLIITTGGVSVGARDLVPDAMGALHAQVLFHGIEVKPGMPTMGSVYNGVPVLSLSGNPFSAAAIFELLGRPLIHRMQGAAGEVFIRTQAVLSAGISLKGSWPRVMMGYYDGTQVTVTGHQRNAQMRYGIGSNCIVIFPPGKRMVAAGEKTEILL